MAPKTTYVTVKKAVMVPAPISSSIPLVAGTVNVLGQIVKSNGSQIRRMKIKLDFK